MTLVYEAGRQLTKLRFLMVFSVLCAAGSLWGGYHMLQSYGLAPADGGKLAPLPVRLAWAAGITLLGVGFAAAMAVYVRRYVSRILLDPARQELHLHTVGIFGSAEYTIAREDLRGARYYEGKLDGDGAVDAPWYSLAVKGRRLPFLVDAQGTFHDRQVFAGYVASTSRLGTADEIGG